MGLNSGKTHFQVKRLPVIDSGPRAEASGEALGCIKVAYETETLADEAAKGHRGRKASSYLCNVCRKWHLTTHPRRSDR